MANDNFQEAQKSYDKFIGMSKVATAVVAVIVVFVVLIIS